MFGFSQTYQVYIDTVQNFKHDSSLTTSEAILLNRITYLNGSTNNLEIIFDLDKNIMTWKIQDGKIHQLEIIKRVPTPENLMEVYVKYNTGVLNYVLTQNKDIYENYVLMCREIDGDKVVGWFDPTIKIKKRP
jgi:hypothetical protein